MHTLRCNRFNSSTLNNDLRKFYWQPSLNRSSNWNGLSNRAESWRNRAESWRNRAESWRNRAESWRNRAESWRNRTESWRNRTDSWRNRAESWRNRAESWRNRAESWRNRAESWRNDNPPLSWCHSQKNPQRKDENWQFIGNFYFKNTQHIEKVGHRNCKTKLVCASNYSARSMTGFFADDFLQSATRRASAFPNYFLASAYVAYFVA